jgi:hypothetical protein
MQCWIYLIYLVTIAALAGLPIFSSSGESMVEVCDLTPQLGFDEDINLQTKYICETHKIERCGLFILFYSQIILIQWVP